MIQAKKQTRKRWENTLARSNPKTSSTSRSKTASAATKSAPKRTRRGAASSTPRGYQEFLAAVRRLPDSDDLETWLADHDIIEQARQSAREYLDLSFSALEKRLGAAGAHWSRRAFDELRDLGEEIALAYG